MKASVQSITSLDEETDAFESYAPSEALSSNQSLVPELKNMEQDVEKRANERLAKKLKNKAFRKSSLFLYTGRKQESTATKNNKGKIDINTAANDLRIFSKCYTSICSHKTWRKSKRFGDTQAEIYYDYLVRLPFELVIILLMAPLCLAGYLMFWFLWGISMITNYIRFYRGYFSRSISNQKTELYPLMHIKFTKVTSLESEIDFLLHRAPGYFKPFAIDIPLEAARYFSGSFNSIRLLPDEGLITALQMTQISRMFTIEWDTHNTGEVSRLILDLSPCTSSEAKMSELTLFPGNVLCVRKMELDCKNETMSITIANEEDDLVTVYRPEPGFNATNSRKYKDALKRWRLAKAHLQCALTWYNVSWAHNWVHFHFYDVIAAHTNDIVTPDSVLGVFLTTHIRFTSFINMLGPGSSFFEPQSSHYNIMHQIIPWKVQSTSSQGFRNKVSENTAAHYLKINPKTYAVEGIRLDAFPPQWVTDRDMKNNPEVAEKIVGKLPYLDFCAEYFFVMEKYVSRMWGRGVGISHHHKNLFERDLYHQWIRHIEKFGLPGISSIDPVKLLTTFLWTQLVHTADHVAYSKFFANWGMYSSNVKWQEDGTWKEVLQTQPLKAYKTSAFVHGFCKYNSTWFTNKKDCLTSPHLYDHWKSVREYPKRLKLNLIHQEFLMDMHVVNRKWKWALDVNTFPSSVCF